MKVPIYWLEEYVELPDTKLLTDKLTMIGHMLDKSLVVNGEPVIDLELRGNRADCYSIYGIAREVSAAFGKGLKSLKTEKLIKVNKLANSGLKINTPLVKRAAMTEIYNVKIQKSPKWLQDRLEAYGMESINNIVDLTNYVMIETGEPMHAFDLDKVKGDSLEIRMAKDSEKITTFMGTVLTLTDDDLVWAKGNTLLSVAGAIGGKDNSVSSETKNILLEAANYDRANIRKSIYRHSLLTESGIRHEKDLDPNLVDIAIGRFLYLIRKYGWGDFDSTCVDYYPRRILPWKIKLSFSQLNEIGGVEIERAAVKRILTNLNFDIDKFDKNSIEVNVPTYRTDVKLEEDLIEEILRIYGYENIPAHVLSLEIPKPVTPDFIKQEQSLRISATSTGFNEIISSAFVKEDLSMYNVHPLTPEAKTASLINPPSPDIKYLRATLIPNLFELSQKAIYERESEVRFFEIGKIYYKEGAKYKEERKMGFAFHSEEGDSFIKFKEALFSFFAKENLDLPVLNPEVFVFPISNSFEIFMDKERIGLGGKIGSTYFAEINLDSILNKEKKYLVKLWPKYPPQIEDITLSLPEKTYVGKLVTEIYSISKKINRIELKDIYKDSYTFRIWYQDETKTLTDLEVKDIRERVISSLKNKFGVSIRE